MRGCFFRCSMPLGILAALPLVAMCGHATARAQEFWRVAGSAQRDSLIAELQHKASRVRDGESLYRLGVLLALRASERPTQYEDRLAAERYLKAALRYHPEDPRYLAALGLVLQKGGARVDAARVLERALRVAWKRADSSSSWRRELAWMMTLWAITQEPRVADGANLFHVPNLPVSSPECMNAAQLFCLNFERPAQFNEALFSGQDLSNAVATLRRQLMALYGAALDLDPGNVTAARRLLVHLADEAAWDAYLNVAGRLSLAAPDSAWSYLLVGMGLWRTRQAEGAAAAFEEGLRRLPRGERDALEDPRRVQPPGRAGTAVGADDPFVYWLKEDPLHLTPENERRLEHLARMIYADLAFSAPEAGLRGWDTDRGRVYVRYGAPRRAVQVRRDPQREVDPIEMREAISFSSCQRLGGGTAPESCEISGLGPGGGAPHLGGRWIFWNYHENIPNFIFEKPLRSAVARHKLETLSRTAEMALSENVPVIDPSPYRIAALPAQVARFRSQEPDLTDVVVFPGVPSWESDPLGAEKSETGFFVFLDRSGRSVAARRHPGVPAHVYSATLRGGLQYYVSLETLRRADSAAARWRAVVPVPAPAPGLALSDLLLARSITPGTRDPVSRWDFHISPNPELSFERGEAVAVYFEVYGLRADSASLGTYRARLEITGAQGRSFAARILSVLGRAVGRTPPPGQRSLEWERTAVIRNQRIPDYFVIRLDAEPGYYTFRVTVTTPEARESASAEAQILLTHPGTSEGR